MEAPKIQIVREEAARQGYIGEATARRAVIRALRWLKAPKNKGAVAPTHIRRTMKMMRVEK